MDKIYMYSYEPRPTMKKVWIKWGWMSLKLFTQSYQMIGPMEITRKYFFLIIYVIKEIYAEEAKTN